MACDDEKFCDNYLVLDPKEATWVDLSSLLFSSDLRKRRFVGIPEEHKLRDFQRRWVIFVSVFAQKLLLSMEKPMAFTGDLLEMWLNLLSGNGGFFKLLLNVLRGKMVKPDKSSATFTSAIGHLDTRIELDRSLKPEDRKYKASLSIMASKLSYENEAFIKTVVEDHWKMEFLGFFECWNDYQDLPSTQAFMFKDTRTDPNVVVVAFRGTGPFDADQWRTDVDVSWFELKNVGKIHGGFMKALGLQKGKGWPKEIAQNDQKPFAYYTIREKLRDLLQTHKDAKFIVTGHSLGGALAILFEAVLILHEEPVLLKKLEGVFTFGQPRVGDKQFSEFMEKNMKKYNLKYFRYVYCNDMMPRLPFDDRTLFFRHFGTCVYYNGCYKGKVVKEEPNKNYFSLFWMIPKYLNALWELIRGFIIPFSRGPEYREGGFQVFFRVIGLAIPGLSAHGPQDYDNSTRLGSFPSSLQHQFLEQIETKVPKQD